ncbi:MAG: hypothetical protein WCX48_11320 [Bacteroidales bacterium]|jgi:hypothetical protein
METTIAGKACVVRPLGIKELTEVERDCLERRRRSYLETFAQNSDLLPAGRGIALLEEKMIEAAKWDVEDLPSKYAHDPRRIKLTDEVKRFVGESFGVEAADDGKWCRLVATALDQGTLEESDYLKMTGCHAPKVKVPYVNWWITGSFEGMITFVWTCFRHNGVTRDEVTEALRGDMTLLVDLAREIESLSSPSAGNG